METKTLVDRFGSNRMNAAEPGKLLRGCTGVQVVFAGGMCEVPFFLPYRLGGDKESVGTANTIIVNDLDRHVINLCENVRERRADLVRWLDETPFHPDALAKAQDYCREMENPERMTLSQDWRFEWACHYFVASWMTRGGKGGTKGEFDAGLSIRWKSGGGDSAVRFRSATEGLAEWEKIMRRCTFTTLDGLDFLAECKKRDVPQNGLYADPPWLNGDGDNYTHNIDPVKLRDALESFDRTRIVVRYGDCGQVRELYPEERWTWHRLTGRTQANEAKAEVLLTRNIAL